ncbi:MAG: DUF1178 family protein [Burkholderiaceae bacterium]|nr:DUF1178 family protein [Burkholderiaceae bacterium]MEB2350714.1 DUF1178 family protein [Burkholderiaceae bacterium]
MKVFDLACEHDHRFEGWFGSAQAFDEQLARGFVECPVCTSRAVHRMPSAPRLNLSAAPEPKQPAPQPGHEPVAAAMPTPQQLQALWMKMARHLAENTEDVGERFADEARRIHYNEAPERGIRGLATREQRAELEDEGIDVFAFPLPAAAKEPLQ